MARRYELKRRAERQAQTRRRIVEATVALHEALGPAQTSISAIAQRAGVQRHTVYAHFPDETTLLAACSGLYMERHPWPDPESWLRERDPRRRARLALRELYAHWERTERMQVNVLRDADLSEATRRTLELRRSALFGRMAEVIAEPFAVRGRRRERLLAAIAVALSFRTWRTLVRDSGLDEREAVEVAVRLILAQ